MQNIHKVEYYSALKRKEILIPATTWMNLENTRLSEKSQRKDYMFYDSISMKCPKWANS